MTSLQAFQEALRQSPENVPLLLLYGRACMEELLIDEAVAIFEKAVELNPLHTDAMLALARALILSGDTSNAAVRAELVLQQEPSCAAAHLLLSRVHLAEGDRMRARQHFDKAAQIDPSLLDTGLEKDLGRTLLDARRNPQPGVPSWESPSQPSERGAQMAGDPGIEMDEDMFMDEPPYDWRPETFWMAGDPDRNDVTFADVGGLEEIKEEIRRRIVYPLQQPELYRAYGKSTGGALLLYGPPGCGKTLLMRAVAGEVGCNYLSVGLHEIFDPYFGSTERNLHQMFETARFNAPCVLVIDGLDSLGQDRRQVRESQLRNVVNQLLHELDGLSNDEQRVLVLAATSQPWSLDPALCRAGRFEQALFVPPPDAETRLLILNRLAAKMPLGRLDFAALVKLTEGFSGADLKWVMDRAAELTLGQALQSGQPMPVPGKLVLEVARQHQPSVRQWFEGVREAGDGSATDINWISGAVRQFMTESSPKR